MEKVVWSVLAFSLFSGHGVFARMRKMPLDRRGRVCWFIGLYDIYIGRSFRRAEKTDFFSLVADYRESYMDFWDEWEYLIVLTLRRKNLFSIFFFL